MSSNIKTCSPMPMCGEYRGEPSGEQFLGELLNTVENQQDNIRAIASNIDTILFGASKSNDEACDPADGYLDKVRRMYLTNNKIISILDHVLGRL